MTDRGETSLLLPNYNAAGSKDKLLKTRAKLRFASREKKKNTKNLGSMKGVLANLAQRTSSLTETDPFKHSKLYIALNPKSQTPSAHLYRRLITFIITLDVLVFIISTEPSLFYLSNVFYGAEAVSSVIFAFEYIARLIVCTEMRRYGKHGPFNGRLKYMITSQAIIDALSTFPFFIEILSGYDLPTFTFLRVFRMIRITRSSSSSKAMAAVGRVLYFNSEILSVAGILGVYLVLITSILMYFLRPRGEDVKLIDDPTDFQSIPSTIILATLMLTGQGGPSGNLPWYTQMVVLLTGVFSVAMFAIPASMLTWGFEAEAGRLGAKTKKREMAKKQGIKYNSDTSNSSQASENSVFGDINTSDEEYLDIIGGGDEAPSGNIVEAPSSGRTQFSTDIDQSLLSRMEMIEQSIAMTNNKVDLILQKLEALKHSTDN